MNREEMLARLVAEGVGEGGDLATLRAIVAEASDLGAERMLNRIGLSDERAPHDIDELRELLRAWRDAKASAWRAVVEWAVRGLLAMLLIGIALRFGQGGLLR